MATLTKIPDMHIWSQCIGGLIINFGILEFQTFRWMQVLANESEAIKNRGEYFGPRIKRVLGLIESSEMEKNLKKESTDLWNEVKTLSNTRNRIAHNPIAIGKTKNNELSFSIIDLKKMLPTGAELELLDYTNVHSIALRAGEIGNRLNAIINSIP